MKAWFSFPYDQNIYFQEGEALSNPISNDALFIQTFDKQERLFLDIANARVLNIDKLQNESFQLVKSSSFNEVNYVDLVTKGIQEIKNGGFKKVVLARAKEVAFNKNPIEIFKHLCKEYHNCFAHLIQFDDGYCSIGATPERLLHWSPEKIMSSSIAGTVSEKNHNFTQKEREEQLIVTEYIADIFKQNNLSVVKEESTIGNGNLEHLFTEITSVDTLSYPRALKLLEELNPTPAVGGFPKRESLQWINQHEQLQRRWYSGAIGVMGREKIRTYVNLRCGLLFEHTALLFAGAGITEDSNAEKEYQETEVKMNNLGAFLNS